MTKLFKKKPMYNYIFGGSVIAPFGMTVTRFWKGSVKAQNEKQAIRKLKRMCKEQYCIVGNVELNGHLVIAND